MQIEHFFQLTIPYIAGFLELIGVVIILIEAIRSLLGLIRNDFDSGNVNLKLKFAKALALSLQFKLGGEILKTVIVQSLEEFWPLAAITIIRIIISLVIHWEIGSMEGE